eukprot:4803287-Pleurochrysis_carterae.AAC.1
MFVEWGAKARTRSAEGTREQSSEKEQKNREIMASVKTVTKGKMQKHAQLLKRWCPTIPATQWATSKALCQKHRSARGAELCASEGVSNAGG